MATGVIGSGMGPVLAVCVMSVVTSASHQSDTDTHHTSSDTPNIVSYTLRYYRDTVYLLQFVLFCMSFTI